MPDDDLLRAKTRMPTYFLSHGGEPWPSMPSLLRANFRLVERAQQAIPGQLPRRPRAVLVVSGRWVEPEFTISSPRTPRRMDDDHHIPAHTSSIGYRAPGSPEIAERVQGLLTESGSAARSHANQGFGHGGLCVLRSIYPRAEVPVVELSLKKTLDAAGHFAVGQVLAPLRDEGVLIIGSGLTYHNARLWDPAGAKPAAAFDAWLRRALLETEPANRRKSLEQWDKAPAPHVAHPRKEDLIPLMVAVGAAGEDPATCIYGERLMGHVAASSFRFGADRTPSRFDRLGMRESGREAVRQARVCGTARHA